MDPVSLMFTFLMQHPEMLVSGAQQVTKAGQVDVVKMQSSFADMSREILKCYHKTARYQTADVLQSPWNRQMQYGADTSALLRISYQGYTGARYVMHVAVLGRKDAIRAAVVDDNARVPRARDCVLEDWKSSASPK